MTTLVRKSWLCTAILIAACGGEQTEPPIDAEDLGAEEIAALEEGKADLTAAQARALPPGARHIYFGRTELADLVEDADGAVREDLAYRWFVARGGREFKVGAAVVDDTSTPVPGVGVGFKLQRLARSGNRYVWIVVGRGDGEGATSLRYVPPSYPATRVYLLTATASPLPQQLRVDLGCAGGTANCATTLQPGEGCGGKRVGRRSCDEGLFCSYDLEAQCGAGDAPGVCEVRPQVCPRGIRYTPVCGCDGRTYDGGCNAGAAGTSVQRPGPCEVNLIGGWVYSPTGTSRYSYNFEVNGTFSAHFAPACLFSTPPCSIPQQFNSGTYQVPSTDTLFLHYTEGPHAGETVPFRIQGTGVRTRLVGHDFGQDLVLQRVR